MMEFKEEKNRIVLLDGEKEIGELTWINHDGYFTIDHTRVNPEYNGRGLAGQLVEKGVEKARRDGLKIEPVCPFAAHEFETKAEYADVKK